MSEKQWLELSPENLPSDFNQSLVHDWALLTAGSPDALATMTINWGGSGFIWNKNIIFMVVRESRNTLTQLKAHPDFSLGMFDSSYRDKLTFCGRNSGRDVDKTAACDFHPGFYGDSQTPYFNEAHTVIFCRQIYRGLMNENDFIGGTDSPLWETFYNTGVHTGDKHNLIIASIEKIIKKQP